MTCACNRFKTAYKRNGNRLIVACRNCGKRLIVGKIRATMAGPVGRLP
jgi:hypothetical protein